MLQPRLLENNIMGRHKMQQLCGGNGEEEGYIWLQGDLEAMS